MTSVNQICRGEVTVHRVPNMINEGLTNLPGLARIGREGTGNMARELMLAAFIMAVGLCIAGAGTHLLSVGVAPAGGAAL